MGRMTSRVLATDVDIAEDIVRDAPDVVGDPVQGWGWSWGGYSVHSGAGTVYRPRHVSSSRWVASPRQVSGEPRLTLGSGHEHSDNCRLQNVVSSLHVLNLWVHAIPQVSIGSCEESEGAEYRRQTLIHRGVAVFEGLERHRIGFPLVPLQMK